jgi:acyl-CoA reductase-like NAD-dependent aldehyde dehydrogenase
MYTDGRTYADGRMLIGGELVESRDGGWLETINPADETPLGRVPMGSAADMKAAVDAAEKAQAAWAALSMAERTSYIKKLGEALMKRADEIAKIETLDTGNTIGPMRRDVTTAVDRMNFYCGIAYELKGETIPGTTAPNLHFTLRVPYGVVGRIIPFNHPIGFAASRLAPALVAGNTIVIKPSEQSPLSSCILGELCAELLPPGTVNIVTGGRDTGEALVRDKRVKRIAFIGSAAAGMAIQKAAAETAVKHVTLELGGKNPLIIFPDADLDKAAAAAVRGMNFSWQGQSCGSSSRLLLHESIHDAVVERVIKKVATLKIGNPVDPATSMGPINSKAQFEKVKSYIKLGQEEGAKLVFGGGRPAGEQFQRGYWVEPTVFTNVTMSMRLAREEIFGPVLSVLRWKDVEEALTMANAVDYGLTGAVFTKDLDNALKVAQRIDAGYIWVNEVGPHYRGVPYGGFKNSGVGREEGLEELLSYTEAKAINVVFA